MSIRRITLIAAPALAGAFIGLGPSAATAEGNAEMGPQNSNSICSYSGLNDNPEQGFPEDGRTQNYGQFVQKGAVDPTDKTSFERPNVLCNAHNLPWQDVTGSH